jgi:hypothetical protein
MINFNLHNIKNIYKDLDCSVKNNGRKRDGGVLVGCRKHGGISKYYKEIWKGKCCY